VAILQHNPAVQEGEPRLRWLFLDLNSYFASVEQELVPSLQGRPIAVVPVVADTTCCIAASYEAKAFGVKTGTQVGEAKRMCRGIELVEARHELYVEYHNRIVEAVETVVPVASVMSIDEMACRLVGREQPLLAALDVAQASDFVRAMPGGLNARIEPEIIYGLKASRDFVNLLFELGVAQAQPLCRVIAMNEVGDQIGISIRWNR